MLLESFHIVIMLSIHMSKYVRVSSRYQGVLISMKWLYVNFWL